VGREKSNLVPAARFFRVEFCANQKDQATKLLERSGRSRFIYETPLIDSLPARMIPKSGLPVFGQDHAQEKEAERWQTHLS
jgi:hypothetical protein